MWLLHVSETGMQTGMQTGERTLDFPELELRGAAKRLVGVT